MKTLLTIHPKEGAVMRKQLIMKSRRRVIEGSFSFIPHRFLREGFFECLRSEELILYFFYVMVADAQGLSYYSPKTITQLLKMKRDVYQQALSGLLQMDLIATEETLVQVLHLPLSPLRRSPSPSDCKGPCD